MKKLKLTFSLSLLPMLIIIKNIDRILEEFDRYNYNPLINAHYYIDVNTYHFNKILLKAEKKRDIDGKKFYIVLDRNLINYIRCLKMTIPMIQTWTFVL